ncbi:hypothetical protein K7I13_09745 [Brucepastera parasyntrophica]|uniref:hypothetical protein n=1 Tax=Brucepastera parasyntrophica TaxID=2880008 RepID=UPI0021091AA5|nr:hypothetical protein [Brucepastera parasyntrophica]ULQ58816.1 hypothetical protein K7I13_09745 [Brucepastera parasyntrophica]
MKKLLIVTTCVCAVIIGCSSGSAVKDVSAVSPLGIVSLTSNDEILWNDKEKTSSGLLGFAIDKTVQEKTALN